jgi:hypothetical protein
MDRRREQHGQYGGTPCVNGDSGSNNKEVIFIINKTFFEFHHTCTASDTQHTCRSKVVNINLVRIRKSRIHTGTHRKLLGKFLSMARMRLDDFKKPNGEKRLRPKWIAPRQTPQLAMSVNLLFINKEDAEHFRKKIDSMDSLAMGIAAGVAGAATIGVLVGPVGLLVGAAALSIGFRVSQIPEEIEANCKPEAAALLRFALPQGS